MTNPDATLATRPLSGLKPWSENYHRGDVDAIRKSISRFGFNSRLAVWRDDVIVAGNHAWKALVAMRDAGEPPPTHIEARDGDWLVPIVDVTHLPTREEAYAYAIADNRTRDLAESDAEALVALLQQIADADASLLDAVGHDADDLLTMLNELAGDTGSGVDAEPQIERASELRGEWGTEVGQLWALDAHRLIIGDATDPDVIIRLMAGERAALFATDPPYLVDYDGTNHPAAKDDSAARKAIKNKDWSGTYKDWDSSEQGEALYDGFVRVAIEHAIEPSAAWYCWHASRRQAMLEAVWEKHGAFAHQQIIWVKDRGVLTRSHYLWQHEPCLFSWIRGQKPRRTSKDYPTTVWPFPTLSRTESPDHPTPKPIELFEIPMRQHTRIGEVCYEPFAGSGTQIIAGERLDRRVFAAELAPEYAAVTLQRWADATGKTPELQEERG